MTKQEKFNERIGKVIEKSYRAKIKNKEGKTVGYIDVQLFSFAQDAKAQTSIERSFQQIDMYLPR
jgi:hypothetical protein